MHEARNRYEAELRELSTSLAFLQSRNNLAAWIRPFLFLPAAILLVAGYTRPNTPVMALWTGWGLAIGFLLALAWHESIRLMVEANEIQTKLYRRLLARLDRKWSELNSMKLHPEDLRLVTKPESEDLDVFGQRSLFQWISLASTRVGRRTLAKWLMHWEPSDCIEKRQAAVQELKGQHQVREQILFIASQLSDSHANPEAFTEWAASSNWLRSHPKTWFFSWAGPALVLLGILWILVARTLESNYGPWVGLGILATGLGCNLLLMMGMIGAIHDIFSRITTGHGEVGHYRVLYDAIATIQGKSELVRELRQICCEGPKSAVVGFAKLRRYILMANLQRAQIFYIPYLILQLLFQWDVRVLELLERWKVVFGEQASRWLDALGQWEAILSAATVADEYREWTYPQWTQDRSAGFLVQKLGHPLLPDNHRVGNDLSMDSKRPLLLVTGSNMAGKSTMLRSLGLNLLMARTGAPMCAAAYRGPVFDLATSIRVQDSLQDGVSFFMAELHRLRDVVEMARKHAVGDQRPVLALLDEILQGTNSRERQIAVLSVVEQLLELGAITAISTHDLELADKPEIVQVAQIVHFREYFETIDGQEQMRFDYLMRPGPTPTTNAVKLLEMVGLGKKPKK